MSEKGRTDVSLSFNTTAKRRAGKVAESFVELSLSKYELSNKSAGGESPYQAVNASALAPMLRDSKEDDH
jgi:hypothetical protein